MSQAPYSILASCYAVLVVYVCLAEYLPTPWRRVKRANISIPKFDPSSEELLDYCLKKYHRLMDLRSVESDRRSRHLISIGAIVFFANSLALGFDSVALPALLLLPTIIHAFYVYSCEVLIKQYKVEQNQWTSACPPLREFLSRNRGN